MMYRPDDEPRQYRPKPTHKPYSDLLRYEIAKAALEEVAALKGSWDGESYSIAEDRVVPIAQKALALIAKLDKEAAK